MEKRYFRYLMLSFILGIMVGMTGCGKEETQKKDLEYTVVAKEEIPEELLKTIEERKEAPFKGTYAADGYLYICVGYGVKARGGYSIQVKELKESNHAIYVTTALIGPKNTEEQQGIQSYPVIVVKTEYRDKSVVFDS